MATHNYPNDLPQDDQILVPEDNDDTKSPARQDEELQESVELDDDIDKLAKEYTGREKAADEELDITKDIPLTTESEPPEEE